MPSAILKFNLEEEEAAFKDALHGKDYKLALWNLDQMLRSHIKHGELKSPVRDALQEVRDFLHAELNDRNIPLD